MIGLQQVFSLGHVPRRGCHLPDDSWNSKRCAEICGEHARRGGLSAGFGPRQLGEGRTGRLPPAGRRRLSLAPEGPPVELACLRAEITRARRKTPLAPPGRVLAGCEKQSFKARSPDPLVTRVGWWP